MSPAWFVLHILGFTMWLGAGLAVMFMGIAAKKEERPALGPVVRMQALLHSALVGPGAMLTVLSGLILSLRVPSGAYGMNTALVVMQLTGILAGLLALFISVPTASRLRRLDPVQHAAAFDELRNRQRLVGMISGVLGIVALVAGGLVRY